ncbi:MAG: FMN-binding protein [Clostridia bacterium]|nr:FMN-binding protein [Clostridia bacterium]
MIKVVLKVVLGVAIVLVALRLGGAIFLKSGLEAGRNLPIGVLDFSKLKDGVYTGRHQAGRWSNEVKVTVSSGRVTDIRILRGIRFATPKFAEDVVRSIMEAQSLQVDTVSGATITTKAYLKAVENALTEAK